jgi:Peptidase_C39 like family
MHLTITKPTFLKSRPLQSVDLQIDEKIAFNRGTKFDLKSCKEIRGHWQVEFLNSANRPGFWFVYVDHCKISPETPTKDSLPKAKKLKVGYRSQLDNQLNPTGACNVTSLAMCLDYLGIKCKEKGQLEDELYRYAEWKGYDRHSPQDLARIVRDYGKKDDFTPWGTFDRCKSHLTAGNPCVIHGYFTSFGHIVVLVGYDDKGFIVHDPYGEWFSDGYRNDLSGEYLHYSYELIQQTCIPDGQFWVHYISK